MLVIKTVCAIFIMSILSGCVPHFQKKCVNNHLWTKFSDETVWMYSGHICIDDEINQKETK